MPSEKAIINAFFIAVVTFVIMPVGVVSGGRHDRGDHKPAEGNRPEQWHIAGIGIRSFNDVLIWPFVVAIGWS